MITEDRPMPDPPHEPTWEDAECPNCSEGFCGGDHPVEVCASCGDDWPCSIAAAEERGRQRGRAEAIADLREIGRDAHDGAPFQNIADAIADVFYVGKQVSRGHGRYLADAAILALIAYLEAKGHQP